jgi:nitrous oxidase accessory protein
MIQITIYVIVHGCNKVLRKLISSVIFIILLFSFLIISVGICRASDENILYVGGSGAGNYSYIQDAINYSKDQDTIYVYDGEYHENITIDKSLNLVGSNKDTVHIFGNGRLYAILVKSSWVNISGFTIQNSQVGICIFGHSFNNISENIIINNVEGLHLDNSSNNIINKNFVQNPKKTGNKFAIVCFESCNNIISENTFTDNPISLYLGRWSDNNVISDNSITNYTYGVRMDFSFNNVICGNLIKNGERGVYLTNSKYNNIIYNNIEDNRYSGVYLTYLKDNVISPNNFTNNYNDIGEGVALPKITAPGFEILFAISAIFFVSILYRRRRHSTL